jgi:hypothetical protein
MFSNSFPDLYENANFFVRAILASLCTGYYFERYADFVKIILFKVYYFSDHSVLVH